jgi:thiol-disulfide isomerase/thioredoxin
MAPEPPTDSELDRAPRRARPSRRHLAISVAIALVAALLTAVVLSAMLDDDAGEAGPGVNLAEAKPAPTTPFTSLRGGEASLADYAGTPVILNFFAESCVPCRKEMPDLQRVHEEIGDRVTVLGIDQGDTAEVANAFVAEMGVTYPTGIDPTGDFAREFGIDYLPGTIFITRTGDIVGVHRGQLSYDDLRRLADEHLQ